uniref:Uncharacterized protein n=1 Tax=Mimiviridae sp. ChoanoV1 TaxID=2596887 RepID=A0A5B8IIE7_9VIRU|nr:hypothetical protein 3_71 [Mimiviridae sp. ChoanoV1]
MNLLELGFSYNHIYEAYIITQPNYVLKINFQAKENKDHFLIIKYNSLKKANISFTLNDICINKDILKTETRSQNKILAFQEQIGPFKLKKGINNIKLICKGDFPLIYNLEIKDTPVIKNSNYLIESIFKYRMSDFILLENYNEYGGFYWNVYNAVICHMICEKYNKIPIFNFNSSLFRSNTNELNLIHKNNNWFYNYFKDSNNIPYTFNNNIINFEKKKNFNLKTAVESGNKSDDYIYYFNYNTFLNFNKLSLNKELTSKRKFIQEKIQILDYIIDLSQKIKKDIFPEKYDKLIGIHYRGTDKIKEGVNDEESPIHYTYDSIYQCIKEKINDIEDTYIVITTDENPFILYMIEKFGDKIIYFKNADRSEMNTSGLNYFFDNTPARNVIFNKNTLQHNQLKEHNMKEKLINNSIHIGSKNVSNYKKGLDCILDALMLQDCDIIYKSKGNFSNFCTYFNTNPNLEVIPISNLFN